MHHYALACPSPHRGAMGCPGHPLLSVTSYLEILQDLGAAILDLARFFGIQDDSAQLSQEESAAGVS